MHYHYNKLLLMLSLNLLLFNVFYIIFASLSGKNMPKLPACESIGILLHFFLLSSFFLMSSMSLLRYLMIVQVFTDIRRFNLISILLTYSLSLIIIIISTFLPPGPQKYVAIKSRM
jgi:hypothetical protein